MKGRPHPYSADELAWIKERRKWPRRDLQQAFCECFGRDVTSDAIKALCLRQGWKTGRTGRFPPGHAPANKGKKMPYNANSARTRFRKGQKPQNTKYLGHECVRKDGYVWISIAEVDPYTGFERRYVQKHRYLWEKSNGPIPDGMLLKCLDGDRANTEPSNWKPLPRAILPRLNGRSGRDYDKAPAELKSAILRTAELEHRARELRRGQTQPTSRQSVDLEDGQQESKGAA